MIPQAEDQESSVSFPSLHAVPSAGEETVARQADEAWREVLDGFDRALTKVPPGHPERDHLLRCRDLATAGVRGQTRGALARAE